MAERSAQLREAFDLFDKDKDGMLERACVRSASRAVS
jgi:Ca2+-binding EF-hand superfamily protein